jgi:hypothetical protein
MIDPPKDQEDRPDRLTDCEEALEARFQTLMAWASARGWTPAEAHEALRRLIAADEQAEQEEKKLKEYLAIMRARERTRR